MGAGGRSAIVHRGFFAGAAERAFCQTALRTVIASIVALKCFVEVTSLNFLLPELYLKMEILKTDTSPLRKIIVHVVSNKEQYTIEYILKVNAGCVHFILGKWKHCLQGNQFLLNKIVK